MYWGEWCVELGDSSYSNENDPLKKVVRKEAFGQQTIFLVYCTPLNSILFGGFTRGAPYVLSLFLSLVCNLGTIGGNDTRRFS